MKQANFFAGISSSILVMRGGVEFVQYQKEFSDSAGVVLLLVAKNQKEFEVDILKDGQPHKIELLAQTQCEVDNCSKKYDERQVCELPHLKHM
ncbi:MAG: hypothetical protein EZS28_003911 [Streblomastix strix]|uniref:Uncharacterized protein n=1 Tax=Streblomastix strix TaxID=222440 RepID=A0A5J4X095_9EUKA|nr:MAG: hypothetical protein EZS28_003911 [Streblomastix strix]